MDNKFHLEKVKQNVEVMKRELPVILANDAQRFFVDNFRKQGWQDGSLNKWKDPERLTKPGKSSRLKSATLVQSGRLRQAVANSIRNVSFDKTRLIVDVPYAEIHNNGGVINKAAGGRATFFKTKVSSYVGLKQSKKTGKFYMAKSTKTIHLRGKDQQVKAHVINMPQRKYMGDSKTLREIQKKKIIKAINHIWVK